MKKTLLCVDSRCTLNASKSIKSFVVMVFMIASAFIGTGLQAQNQSEYDEILSSLLNDLHPTMYLTNGQITTYGTDSPEVLICDTETVSLLNTSDPLFASIKLIRLKIEANNSIPSIDLNDLQGFETLQYFMVEFTYDQCGGQSDSCLSTLVNEHINSNGTAVLVLSKLSIPN